MIEDTAANLARLKAGLFTTGSTNLAAALTACGVEPLPGAERCTNTYDDDHPRRPGRPGRVLYHTGRHSRTFEGVAAEDLAKAYESETAAEDFDKLLAAIDDDELREKIEAALPLAVMSYGRAMLENRDKIRTWWRDARPMVFIRRGKKSYLLPATAKQTAKKWGLSK